ncbi:unnamed protein product, partial [Symbiodinium sp. KB8]
GIKVLWQKIAEASRRPLLLGGDARCPLNAALAIGYVKDAVAAIRAAGDSGDLSVLGPYFTALLYTAESVVKAAKAEAAATRSAVCESMESAADIEDFYHGGLIEDMMASIRSSLAAGGVPASFLTTEPGMRLMAQEKQRLLNKVESALAKKAVEVIREMEKQLTDKAKTVDPDELDVVALELLNDAAVAKGGKDLASYLSANVTQYAEFGMAVSRVRAMAAEHKRVEEERRKVEEEKRAALEREAAVKEEMRKAKAEKDAELEEMRQTINDLKEAQRAGG